MAEVAETGSPSGQKDDSWQGVIPIRKSDPSNLMPWELEEDEVQNTAQRGRNVDMRADLKARQQKLSEQGKDGKSALKADDEHIEVPKSRIVEEQHSLQQKNSKELPPWWQPIQAENRVLRLHEELLNFMNFLEASDEELKARNDWIDSISHHVEEKFGEQNFRVILTLAL